MAKLYNTTSGGVACVPGHCGAKSEEELWQAGHEGLPERHVKSTYKQACWMAFWSSKVNSVRRCRHEGSCE